MEQFFQKSYNGDMGVTATSWLAPELFKKEFQNYKERYLKSDDDADLVMTYITMQLFIENHFHYYLRFIIGDGFGSAKPTSGWNEKDYPNQKIDCLKKFLSDNGFMFTQSLFDKVTTNYKTITDIRNLLAHGHRVTTTYAESTKTNSKAKDFLNRQEFAKACHMANEIADAWNALLTELQSQEALLKSSGLPMAHFFDNCKFKVF